MRCTTLDALTQNAPFASGVDLLKIDTDGHEFEVLEGARDLLQRDRPALLIECDARGDPAFGERCAELVAQLVAYGYHGFLIYRRQFRGTDGTRYLPTLAPSVTCWPTIKPTAATTSTC